MRRLAAGARRRLRTWTKGWTMGGLIGDVVDVLDALDELEGRLSRPMTQAERVAAVRRQDKATKPGPMGRRIDKGKGKPKRTTRSPEPER